MRSSHKKRNRAVDVVLKWARKGLTLSQQVVPLHAYGPIAQVLLELIGYIESARTNKQAAEAVLCKIETLAEIVGKSKEELDNRMTSLSTTDQQTVESVFRESSGLQVHFESFYRDLKRLKARSKGLKHKWYLRWLFIDDDAEIIRDIQDGVSNAITFFQTRCQVAMQRCLETIDEKLGWVQSAVNHVATVVEASEVDIAQRMEADNRILESLPHADASYRASINEMRSKFLEGTRSGLLAELEQWVEGGLSNKSVCVLTGGAGTGKSTVASELARRLDRHGTLGASFFFARGVTDLDSTRVFFSTIAYQLARWTKGTLRQPIIDAARDHLSRGQTQAMVYEAPALLHTPLESADTQSPIYVVVDALDECTQEAYKLVPEMLHLLMASIRHGPLRIFLTFRPDQLVENKLFSSQWSNNIQTISIDTFSEESSRDVAAFIGARLSEMAQGPELLRRRPQVTDRLAVRAQGLFIYARTAMDFLETYPGTLEEGVDVLLSEEEGVTLGTLDQLYLTVLVNAFPPDHMKCLRPHARVQSVLACIALLRNPMTPRTLESLTSPTRTPITCQDTDYVLDRLRSVVVFKRDAPDEVFRPIYSTFPQFLVDSARCTNPQFLVHPQRQHARLAEACLKALLSLDENMCQLDDSALDASIGDIADLQDRIATLVPQHVQYACVHWAAHLREACRPQEHTEQACFCVNLVELLQRFVSEKMLPWMELLALMGRVDGAMDDLGAARDWVPSNARYDALHAYIDQGLQILLNYTDDIRECPHCVYRVREQRPARSSKPLARVAPGTDMYGNYINFLQC